MRIGNRRRPEKPAGLYSADGSLELYYAQLALVRSAAISLQAIKEGPYGSLQQVIDDICERSGIRMAVVRHLVVVVDSEDDSEVLAMRSIIRRLWAGYCRVVSISREIEDGHQEPDWEAEHKATYVFDEPC